MECILGDNLLVKDSSNGKFVFTIDDGHEVTMSSYEMASFIYGIRLVLYGKPSERKTIKRIVLQEKYKLNSNDIYEASILIDMNESDSINISLKYSRISYMLNYKNRLYYNSIGDGEEEIVISVDASLPEIDELIQNYIDYEYSIENEDD